VLGETGATKVDIVGWSQGGMMPRYYINDLGGAAKVSTLVGLAPSNYGTTLDGVVNLLSGLGSLGVATALLSAANVQDITLQSQCPQDHSDHLSIPYESNALQDMINALGPDNPAFQPACAPVGPLIGNV
jgi:Lipase (class 2)